jgi:predicted RNA binding protein YcfA (HicA-like mRNA interferase family)
VSKKRRLLAKVLSGASDSNLRFDDVRSLLLDFGFEERIRGSHHIFSRSDVAEILNLQPRGSMAKGYQVKQVRTVIVDYRLASEADSIDEAESAGDGQ